MPIEKLDLRKTCLVTDHPAIVASAAKINELIDAFNTREQDRSEQMCRMIDNFMALTYRVEALENDKDILMDTLNSSGVLKPFSEAPKDEEDHQKGCCSYQGGLCTCVVSGIMRKDEELEIKNCPFCKFQPIIRNHESGFDVKCNNECCLTLVITKYYKKTKQEAIAAWNRRLC